MRGGPEAITPQPPPGGGLFSPDAEAEGELHDALLGPVRPTAGHSLTNCEQLLGCC